MRNGLIRRHGWEVVAHPRWLLFDVHSHILVDAVRRRWVEALRLSSGRLIPWVCEVRVRREVVEVESTKLALLLLYCHSHIARCLVLLWNIILLQCGGVDGSCV